MRLCVCVSALKNTTHAQQYAVYYYSIYEQLWYTP